MSDGRPKGEGGEEPRAAGWLAEEDGATPRYRRQVTKKRQQQEIKMPNSY